MRELKRLSVAVCVVGVLSGCQAEEGLNEAWEELWGGLASALSEAINRAPANVRATSDLGCDVDALCRGEAPGEPECSLADTIWRPEIEAGFIGCTLECGSDFDCVQRAVQEAGLGLGDTLRAGCLKAAEACEVTTDACEALPALDEATREAVTACNGAPCLSRQACYRDALLGALVGDGGA